MNFTQRGLRARVRSAKTNGFTLLELLVVIVILGLMATIAVPALMRQIPDRERKAFVSRLNALTSYAIQRSIEQRKIHKITFDMAKRTIALEQAQEKDSRGEWKFKPVVSPYLSFEYQWPAAISIKNFYVDKQDPRVSKLSSAWFFVMSDGITQEVIINVHDEKGKYKQFSLTINPFSGEFKEERGFKKP